MGYARELKFAIAGFGPHALRATATINALNHGADIAKVQEWLGHANIATTRITIDGQPGQRTVRPSRSVTEMQFLRDLMPYGIYN